MLSGDGDVDHRVALWIEGHDVDVRPVACVARPTRRVALLGLEVQRVACRQDGLVLPVMALRRADVADAAVAMIDVVPTHEVGGPGASCSEIDEAFGRGSDESTRYGLELFRKLNLQLLIVTPLQKLHIIEGHVNSFHFVSNKDGNNSQVSNFTKQEYEIEKAKHDSLFRHAHS